MPSASVSKPHKKRSPSRSVSQSSQSQSQSQSQSERHQIDVWRKNRYHLVASKNGQLTSDPDAASDYLCQVSQPPKESSGSRRSVKNGSHRSFASFSLSPEEKKLRDAKSEMLKELARSGGDTTGPDFLAIVERLSALYSSAKSAKWDARVDPEAVFDDETDDESVDVGRRRAKLEGHWLTLSRPSFPGNHGRNDFSELIYSLGHMSFDMFRPTDLICSIQGTFNNVHVIRDINERDKVMAVPKSLMKEVRRGDTLLRTYDIVTAFTIESRTCSSFAEDPASPNQAVDQPIHGIMTTTGYALPDPEFPHRLSVWFTGGKLEVNEDADLDAWKSLLEDANANCAEANTKAAKRNFSGKAKIFAAKMLMGAKPPEDVGGMDTDGTISYMFGRPLGGHGKTYVDVLYMDETLRVVRGSRGSVMVFARVYEN